MKMRYILPGKSNGEKKVTFHPFPSVKKGDAKYIRKYSHSSILTFLFYFFEIKNISREIQFTKESRVVLGYFLFH